MPRIKAKDMQKDDVYREGLESYIVRGHRPRTTDTVDVQLASQGTDVVMHVTMDADREVDIWRPE